MEKKAKERPVGPYPMNSHVRCIYSQWKKYTTEKYPHLRCCRRGCTVDPDNHMCELGVRLNKENAFAEKSPTTIRIISL